jgi:hypothetical protein
MKQETRVSKKRSGDSPHQRKAFLESRGFYLARQAAGGHEVWEHTKLKELMQSPDHGIVVEGLPSRIDPKMAWQMTFCGDPGHGLWKSMEKQANACQSASKSGCTGHFNSVAPRPSDGPTPRAPQMRHGNKRGRSKNSGMHHR